MKTVRLALLLTLFASIAAQAATISGTVTSDNGSPLGSMTVAAYTTGGALQTSAVTTAAGAYSLTLPAGSYHVLAYDAAGVFATSFYADAESFETSNVLTLTSSQSATNINFRLVAAGYATGYVTTTGGTPLPAMTVAAYNADGTRRGFTTTATNGSFTLALPPGTYRIAAWDDALSYTTTFFDDASSFDAAAPVTIAASVSTALSIKLVRGAKVTGIITDRSTLAPLAGMRATAWDVAGNVAGSAITSADGSYAMAVRPATVRIVVDDPNGVYATSFFNDANSFAAATPIVAEAAKTVTASAMLVAGGRIAGRVASTAGAAIANVGVAGYNADGSVRASTTSDATGAYSLLLPPGDYRIGAADPARVWLPQFYSLQTSFGAASVVHVESRQTAGGYAFSLAKAALVAGRVTDGSLGVAGVTVGAYDTGGRLIASATTASSGAYTIALAPGAVKLLAFDPQLRFATSYYGGASFDLSTVVSLTEGTTFTADFAVARAGILAGYVRDANTGAFLPNIRIFVYDASFHDVAETTSDANGNIRIALVAGTYTVAAADPAQRFISATQTVSVTLLDGGTAVFELHAATPGTSARHRSVRH